MKLITLIALLLVQNARAIPGEGVHNALCNGPNDVQCNYLVDNMKVLNGKFQEFANELAELLEGDYSLQDNKMDEPELIISKRFC